MKELLSPLRIAVVYAAFGALWILLSDSALHALVADPDLEARLQTFKGWAYVGVTAVLVFCLTGQYAKVMRDKISESERVRQDLRDSELRLSRHIENTPLGCVSWDRNFICTEWNKSAEKIFGFTAEEAIGRHPAGLLLPPDIEKDIEHVYRSLLAQTGGTRSVNENLTKDGRTILCDWYNTPIIGASGEAVGVSSLVMDITEKRRTEMMMLKAKEDAQAANRTKSEFLATMSHEFRTPLNAILGFSEMMTPENAGAMPPEKFKEYAQDIHRSGRLMLSLVNDVLDVAEIEAGERRLHKEPVNMGEILRDCAKNLEPLAAKAGIDLVREVPDTLPVIRADARSVHQVFLNLVSNAIKFTKEGGRITIAARSDGDGIAVSVADTGVGIPADKLPHICDPFSRLSEDPHKTQVGTGLGLSIVKSLIDFHDGKLGIESELGVGTTVTVAFPAGRSDDAAPEA